MECINQAVRCSTYFSNYQLNGEMNSKGAINEKLRNECMSGVQDTLFANRMELLQQTQQMLHAEFAGIDKVIDDFMHAVRPWYIFPELQERPLVLNLWGLTGTGKTSLVKRFVELIKWEPYFHFDMGECMERKWSIRSQLEDIHTHRNGLPLIFGFDEFQHARSIRSNGTEAYEPGLRLIWELMDSGKFQIQRNNESFTYELQGAMQILKRALHFKVQIKDGKLEAGSEFLKQCITELSLEFVHSAFVDVDSIRVGSTILNNHFLEQLAQETKTRFGNRNELEIFLATLSGNELLQFFKQVFQDYYRPVTIDLSKALIVVMGNLDEAYSGSGMFNPDLSADLFYRDSQQIQLPKIKAVLTRYFRNEQIARLGHVHIIYPALNVQAYKRIIHLQLEKLKVSYFNKLNLDVHFEQSIERLIYREGVNPNQGTRPLFSCIHNLLQSPIAQLALYIKENQIEARSLQIEFSNKYIRFHFIGNDNLIATLKIKPVLRIESLRIARKDNRQALVAVHESGHAILSMLLLRQIPMQVFSATVDYERDGLVSKPICNAIHSQTWLKRKVAVLLGGLCAERLVFGEEGKTLGSEFDLRMATQLVMSALMNNGFYHSTAYFNQSTDENHLALTSFNKEVETACLNWLKEAEMLAFEELEKNKELLLQCSWQLSEKQSLGHAELKKLFIRFARVENHSTWFETVDVQEQYRELLREQLNSQSVEFL